jgi:hypothetical protein
MSNLENSKDIVSIGQQIGHDLEAHNWPEASAALSRYANDLSPDEFTRLIQTADRANNDLSGISFDAVYALEKRPALDRVTGISNTELEKRFLGVEARLNAPGFENAVLITNPQDLGQQVLKFASIYEELGLLAQKPEGG